MKNKNMKGNTVPKGEEAKNSGQGIENPKKMRQIIIETDGSSIHLVSADVAGKIELIGILQGLIGFLNQQK